MDDNYRKAKVDRILSKLKTKEKGIDHKDILLKAFYDILAAGPGGSVTGALTGKLSPIAGVALIVLGHYYKDQLGILKLVGAGALGYGIAKSKIYGNDESMRNASSRFKELQGDWSNLIGTGKKLVQTATSPTSNENQSQEENNQESSKPESHD